jgi:hypothetical protein
VPQESKAFENEEELLRRTKVSLHILQNTQKSLNEKNREGFVIGKRDRNRRRCVLLV